MGEEEIKDLSIGIVSSRFNNEIVKKISKACISKLYTLGVNEKNIKHETVPGALEIPIALQKMKESGSFDVMIAIGLVIRGDTYHFEIVSNESASGIMRVQLDHSIPIINAVLTTNSSKEALARVIIKGEEAAEGAIEMALKIYHND
jgi:6,7-dimethyl-8-ribityllumazine synthase|tara:strand:- start:159 stop:599 length:441 start_codon:yes stop_codon:yes gene_type:complete